MNEKDKKFIEGYEKLLNKGYCDCNEMNCIDNNSPRRILNIVKQLEHNWNELKKWLEEVFNYEEYDKIERDTFQSVLSKMQELEEVSNE